MRQRCLSLDRGQRYQRQKDNGGVYIPGRSPNRSPYRNRTPRCVLSTPEICRQNYENLSRPSFAMADLSLDDREQFDRSRVVPYENDFNKTDLEMYEDFQRELNTFRPSHMEDLPDEFLEAIEEPSFYDVPANISFDEVMCAMASPPSAASEIDDVRKRMAAHIGSAEPEEHDVVVDNVRQRMEAIIAASEIEPELSHYKIPPLPEDPRIIPPHPKDPNDVVAIIRRAKAIARLKAIEEAEAASQKPKATIKKGGRGASASRKQPLVKTGVKASAASGSSRKIKPPPSSKATTITTMTQERPPSPQYPPDYVAPEWAAAILRTRKLAGLKTTNPKLIPKTQLSTLTPKTIYSPHSPLPPPTYKDIMKRAACIRARTSAIGTAKIPQTPIKKTLPTTEEELDEFEALEQLYKIKPNQGPTDLTTNEDLQQRMAVLQRQLYQSPLLEEPTASAQTTSPVFEMPPILRFYDLLRHRETMAAAAADSPSLEYHIPEYVEDLQNLQGIADWDLADLSGPHPPEMLHIPAMSPTQSIGKHITRVATPFAVDTSNVTATDVTARCPKPSRSLELDDNFLQNIEVPDFDMEDIPEFSFTAEALADAGFKIQDDESLAEISMPQFESDISIDEYGLEDITSPDMCDLSISGSGMAFEPDYPLEMTDEEVVEEETPKATGFLTSVVNAVVDRFRNIFSPNLKSSQDGEEDEIDDINLLETSLPNLFETKPALPTTETSPITQPALCRVDDKSKQISSEESIIIPPHPKDPKDYRAMVRRAQAMQKKKAKEAAEAAAAAPSSLPPADKGKRIKREIKSTIPKRAAPPKKKKKEQPQPTKVYPPGEYSPGYAAAVAHARSLAGYKNISAILNPERAARIAEKKAAREAKLAAIEALPPVERMRKKMEGMDHRKYGKLCPTPSIEALGALEAIRASLPIPKTPQPKWKQKTRLRADRSEDSIFTEDFGRIFTPTSRTMKTKRGWKKLDVMSPVMEGSDISKEDLMQFSPLKPHEGQLRLQYIKDQATQKAAQINQATEDAQAAIYTGTPECRRSTSPGRTSPQYSPIMLQSSTTPRTEQTRREKVTSQIGENGGTETIREEVVETSMIENGEVHTSTRQVTTKTDEFGNVTRHIQEAKGVSGEEMAIPEDLADIEPPEFLDISGIPAPKDTSIPTPSEIIDRIRSEVHQKLNIALPTIPPSPRSPILSSPSMIDFPENLPDEELFDIDMPEFERTPKCESPRQRDFTPIEKDQRMYVWGQQLPSTPKPSPTVTAQTLPSSEAKESICLPIKTKTPDGPIVIPPHPKDPKDYVAMVKRAQVIQRLKKQQEAQAAPPPPKDSKKPPRKRLMHKKQIPEAAPKKEYDEEIECPAEPPPLPADYVEHVARARLLHGLKNTTAALNPEVAAKLAAKKAAEETAQAAYDALPEHEKIKLRMEKFRRLSSQNRYISADASMLGTLAAIKANMPPIEEILQPSQKVTRPQTPRAQTPSPHRRRDDYQPENSLDEFEFLEAEAQAETEAKADIINYDTPKRKERHWGRKLALQFPSSSQPSETSPTVYDDMQDFKTPKDQIILDTSNLMPETPPDLQERFRRIKEARVRQPSPSRASDYVAMDSPTADYSPIRFISSSEALCVDPAEAESSPRISATNAECLIDIEAPQKKFAPIRQYRDLEDMPFYELDYEDEPNFEDISLEKPTTPPPQPQDIISRIRSVVLQKLRDEEARHLPPKSPGVLEFPKELPEDELFETSAPSFAHTPQRTAATEQRTPRVSLPMAWGEVRPITPPTRVPSPLRIPTPQPPEPEDVEEVLRVSSPGPVIVPPHPKDPKDYTAMVKRAQAIYKLKKQEEAEEPQLPAPTKRKARVSISRLKGQLPKKLSKKLKKEQLSVKEDNEEERECPAEPPPLPEYYAEQVARARILHGLKNKTAALNPKVAAKMALRKAEKEAAAAAYEALPEHEKIKVRMDCLRKKPRQRRSVKPTMEQLAYLEALKQTGAYESPARPPSPARIPTHEISFTPRRSPCPKTFMASPDLAEFEALEQMEASLPVCPSSSRNKDALAKQIADQIMEEKSLELEATKATPDQRQSQPLSTLEISRKIADLRQELLTTPQTDARERYRQILVQMKAPPKSPHVSPVRTPEMRYSPIKLTTSPLRGEETKRAEKSTTQITRSGKNTIKEQVTETSEIVNGELQHITKHVTTTTDPDGNVMCEINESKTVSARDNSADIEEIEDLADIEEPSFVDAIPVTPTERPRPRDIIERVHREIKEGVGKYRPEAATGQLIELRTPPRMLPLPEEVPDEYLLDLSSPVLAKTPPITPVRTPICARRKKSPKTTPNISIPEIFVATPPTPMPPTPPLPPISPLRQRIHSPEGPIVIPPHPKDPKDYFAMVRRARKIQELRAQEEAERLATEEAAEAAKTTKRVPVSKRDAAPSKKRITGKKMLKGKGDEELRECPTEPPSLPKEYVEQVARARILAGLKNRTAILNPEVAAREAETARIVQENETEKLTAPSSPIRDYDTLLSKMTAMKDKGAVPRGQPSIASAAYLNAVKEAMRVTQQQPTKSDEMPLTESPKSRYIRIKTEGTKTPPPIEVSPVRTPHQEDIVYTPLRFESPSFHDDSKAVAEEDSVKFDVCDFEGLEDFDEIAEYQEPSFMDSSQFQLDATPQTPPETPRQIIRRILEKVQKKQAERPRSPIRTPAVLEFPKNLPEEDLFELSAPSFPSSTPRQETPSRSPNISVPQYFEQTPPSRVPTPKATTPRSASPRRTQSIEAIPAETSSPKFGIYPGVRATTPEGPIVIPPHPKDPTDIAAIVRRAQLIQKHLDRQVAEDAANAVSKIVKRRAPPFKKGKLSRLIDKKRLPKTKPTSPSSLRECPTEPPELPSDYIEAVARARKLAGLKNKTALLKLAARESAKDGTAVTSDPPKPTPPPPDYAAIIKRAADLRVAKTSGMPHVPITQQRKQEINRLQHEFELIRQQQEAANIPFDFEQMKTPATARERFEIIKSRKPIRTPISSHQPYSPAKTPDLAELPHYQPIELSSTPPYKFLENVYIPDIGEVSIPFEVLDDYEETSKPIEQEQFDIAARIKMLQNQLLESPRQRSISPKRLISSRAVETSQQEFERAEARDQELYQSPKEYSAEQEEFDIAARIEMLQNQLLESPRQRSRAAETSQQEFERAEAEARDLEYYQSPKENAVEQEEFDIAARIEMLQNQLLETPRPRSISPERLISSRTAEMSQQEFERAEAEARDLEYYQSPKENSVEQEKFDIAARIEMLQNQLLETPRPRSISPERLISSRTAEMSQQEFERAEAEAEKEYVALGQNDVCERMKIQQDQELQTARQKLISRAAAATKQKQIDKAEAETPVLEFNMAERMEMLHNQLLQSTRER